MNDRALIEIALAAQRWRATQKDRLAAGAKQRSLRKAYKTRGGIFTAAWQELAASDVAVNRTKHAERSALKALAKLCDARASATVEDVLTVAEVLALPRIDCHDTARYKAGLLAEGLCEACHAKTAHGPWTPEQIKEVCDDLGTDPAEFGDWCDDCFVQMAAGGDVAYAQELVGHAMAVTRPEHLAQLTGPKTAALFVLSEVRGVYQGRPLQDQQTEDPA